jgi:hypothetical protein
MDKAFVVKRVAEKLWSTENAIDEAIAETSKLMGELVEGRKALQVPHLLTDEATMKIAASMAAMAEARKSMIEAHHALNETRLRLGVRTKMEIPHNSSAFHENNVVMGEQRQAR